MSVKPGLYVLDSFFSFGTAKNTIKCFIISGPNQMQRNNATNEKRNLNVRKKTFRSHGLMATISLAPPTLKSHRSTRIMQLANVMYLLMQKQ